MFQKKYLSLTKVNNMYFLYIPLFVIITINQDLDQNTNMINEQTYLLNNININSKDIPDPIVKDLNNELENKNVNPELRNEHKEDFINLNTFSKNTPKEYLNKSNEIYVNDYNDRNSGILRFENPKIEIYLPDKLESGNYYNNKKRDYQHGFIPYYHNEYDNYEESTVIPFYTPSKKDLRYILKHGIKIIDLNRLEDYNKDSNNNLSLNYNPQGNFNHGLKIEKEDEERQDEFRKIVLDDEANGIKEIMTDVSIIFLFVIL